MQYIHALLKDTYTYMYMLISYYIPCNVFIYPRKIFSFEDISTHTSPTLYRLDSNRLCIKNMLLVSFVTGY